MKTISKSVLQLTRPVIHENDKEEFFDILNQCQDGIHWELESESFYLNGTNYKDVLRYVPERKEWALYLIYGDTGKEVHSSRLWYYLKKYDDALRSFNRWCKYERTDPAKAKRIKPVFNTQ